MLSVFSKRIINASLATLLLSLTANAMQQQQQQCAPCQKIEKPCAPSSSMDCRRVKHTVTYHLTTGENIEKRTEVVTEYSAKQTWADQGCDEKNFPVEKVCPGESSQQAQKGEQCGQMSAAPISTCWSQKYSGTKTGVLTRKDYITDVLTFEGGDSCLEERDVSKCKVSYEEFLADHMDTRGLTLSQMREATQGLQEQLTQVGKIKIKHHKEKDVVVKKK